MTKIAVALALTLCMGLGAGIASAAAKKDYIFGVGSPGGAWEMVGTAMAKVLNQYATYRLIPTSTTTTMMNPTAMNTGETAFAVGSFDIYERAFKGIDSFKGHPTPNIRQVLSIYDNVMGFLVLGNSKIQAMDDITDKTIIASPPGNYVNIGSYLRVMKEVGILKANPDVVQKNIRRVTYAQSVDQLSDGNADIAYVTGYPYNGNADSVISTKGARFIPVSKDPEVEKRFRAEFDKQNTDLTMLPIRKGTYSTSDADVYGPVFYTCIYSSKDTPDDVVKEFMALSIKYMKEISEITPTASGMTLEANKRNLESGIMQLERMHPAAIAYFKEMGIIK